MSRDKELNEEIRFLRIVPSRGVWVAQLVKHLTSAQVMISQFMGSSPTSGSVLTAQSLEPALDSVCVCVSLCLSPAHALSSSVSIKYTLKKIFNVYYF